jgi:DNA polymerase delta subunit 2
MLVEYLTGEEGGQEQQISAAQITRLIIAGDSLAPIVLTAPEIFDEKDGRKGVSVRFPFTTHHSSDVRQAEVWI